MTTATKPAAKETRQVREMPKSERLCLYHSGSYFCWQIDGKPQLYRKNRFKHKEWGVFVSDFEPLGVVGEITMPMGMEAMEWADLRNAIDYWRNGIT